MRARAVLVAEADGRGVTRLTRVRSEPPLVLRATPEAVYLVGGAGGPLGGDDLALDVVVGRGATLTVRTAAAAVVLPGSGHSSVVVTARVEEGGRLRWLPEPVVAARGCRHRTESTLTLASGAGVVWREEIVLGRHDEPSGSILTRLTADVAGGPLLRHELALGPDYGAGGPAVVGAARAVGSVLLVDPAWATVRPPARTLGPTSALLPLAGPGVHVVALAGDPVELRRTLDSGVRSLATPAAEVAVR